jgi:hypothetical protein
MKIQVPEQSPPSTYAIAAALEGEPGAWGRVAYETGRRAAILAPGIYLAGVRGRKFFAACLLGSVSITGVLLAHYWYSAKK